MELSSSTGPASALTPTESRKASANTIVEWPRENQNPTESGLRTCECWSPSASSVIAAAWSASSLRVVLSMAAMWSASKACRKPEGVGEDADSDVEHPGAANVVVVRHDQPEQDPEADQVQHDDEAVHAGQRRPVLAIERAQESCGSLPPAGLYRWHRVRRRAHDPSNWPASLATPPNVDPPVAYRKLLAIVRICLSYRAELLVLTSCARASTPLRRRVRARRRRHE